MLKSLFLFSYLASLISQPTPRLETERIYPPAAVYATVIHVEPVVKPYSTLGEATKVSAVSLVDGLSVGYVAPTYALPLDWDLIDPAKWASPHHDYPALDVQTPVGTPVFAIREGTITQTSGSSGACGGTVMFKTDIGQIMYCHLSKIVVHSGDWVETGQLVAYSGGRPGAYGAGSSTVAHLHVSITRNGRVACIQPLLVSLANGDEPDLTTTTRCYR